MFRLLRFYLPALCAAIALAGCCANNTCDCQDSRADALYFRFLVDDTATNPQAFLSSEVETVWLLRYDRQPTAADRPRRDSVRLVRPRDRAGELIILNNNAPFGLVTSSKLHSFKYDIRLRDRNQRVQSFRLDHIDLQGRFEGDGCCTCYENSRKTLEVNGQRYDVTETNQQPVVVTLTR